jgi:hypothetical protein
MNTDELQALFPALSGQALNEAMETLDRYLLLAWEIVEEHVPIDGDDGGDLA